MTTRVAKMLNSFVGLSLCLALVAACSDDAEPLADAGGGLDAAADSGVDQSLMPDLGALPDLGQKDPCESEWRDAISPQSTVSTGMVVTFVEQGVVYRTTIDATAGGMSGASKNPYVYVSLSTGKRVDIDDFTAKTDTSWDLALRRAVIRVNGGDSGAGSGAVSIVAKTDLDKVIAVPASSTFATDDFLDASCKIRRDPINNILTAFGGQNGMWYEYDTSSMKLKPNPDTYVVRSGDGKSYYKVYIDAYYSSSGAGANYTLRWARLQ